MNDKFVVTSASPVSSPIPAGSTRICKARLPSAPDGNALSGLGAANIGAVVSQSTTERFREVVLPHLADALALARWLTGNTHDAEDVVQDACLRALSSIGTYAGGNARAWLLAIVRNASITWIAKNRPRSLVLVGDSADLEEQEGSRAV